MNTITRNKQTEERVPVGTLKPGTLVSWSSPYSGGENIYVVLMSKKPSGIAAVNLSSGGFLNSDTLVKPLEAGEKVTIIAGEAE